MVSVKQLIAMEKKAMTKQEYKLIIQMCKQPKGKPIKKKRF